MQRHHTACSYTPPLPVFFGAGLIYATVLFAACGFRFTPPPPTLGAYLVLAFLTLFLGLAHGAFIGLATVLMGRLLFSHRWARGFDALVALGLGLFYSALGLSLLKFAMTGAHLRFADLWFVFGSLRQVVDEGSTRERGMLAAILLVPLGLAGALFVALRLARRRKRSDAAAGSGAQPLAVLAGVAFAALLVLCWRYPYARYVAGT
ncbi:MAG: hypothetical protein ABI689_14920, partial [Thermoanaerobaculia bacterium]